MVAGEEIKNCLGVMIPWTGEMFESEKGTRMLEAPKGAPAAAFRSSSDWMVEEVVQTMRITCPLFRTVELLMGVDPPTRDGWVTVENIPLEVL
jgi:hypothetical protein